MPDDAPGLRDPWPLDGRLDQRDPRLGPKIARYGCAMLLCAAAGAWLQRRPPPGWEQVLTWWGEARHSGTIGDDCFIERWARAINDAAGELVVEYAGPPGEPPDSHDPPDYPLRPGELVFDCWRRQDVDVGEHFTWVHPVRYDPLGSAEPGLSWSRKLGVVVSRRAFRIVGGPRAA